MGEYEIVGAAIVVGVPIVVSFIALLKPIINLNTTMTELNITMKQVVKDNDNIHKTLNKHDQTLGDHEKRIYLIECKEDIHHEN